jgi:ABC-2 type transport system permease protein
MNDPRLGAGHLRHFLLTLQLNLRSRQALIYGYLVPVFFLLAFGSIFQSDSPRLLHEMGQLLTISILGGACFGLPTALVAERERGVWRRYRLLPVPTGSLLVSALAARLLIVASAALLQIILARLVYHTPFPTHPGAALVAFVFVAFSFLGLGLLVAALADDVPAVQALGQCLFLPMIMIGGVGVPLAVLPAWAQKIAGFMPGRYAVDALQRSFTSLHGLHGAGFSLIALGVIGLAAGVIGVRLFRWDAGRRIDRRARLWVAVALLAWVAIGVTALLTGRLQPVKLFATDFAAVSNAQMNAITYDDLPGDNELATRLSPPFAPGAVLPARMQAISAELKTWPPAQTGDVGEDVRHLLSVAAIADVGADLQEAEIGRTVFDELQARYGRDQLRHVLAWVILAPDRGTVVTQAPELDLRRRQPPERVIRERSVLYAKKFLGRLLGKIPDA